MLLYIWGRLRFKSLRKNSAVKNVRNRTEPKIEARKRQSDQMYGKEIQSGATLNYKEISKYSNCSKVQHCFVACGESCNQSECIRYFRLVPD